MSTTKIKQETLPFSDGKETTLKIVNIRDLQGHPANEKYFSENIEKIDSDKRQSTEELKFSIREWGVKQPLLITKDYRILSGHRRWLILTSLYSETKDKKYETVRCLVFNKDLSPIIEEGLIIEMNMHYRNLDRDGGSQRAKLYRDRYLLCQRAIPGYAERLLLISTGKKGVLGLTAKMISEATGLSINTAQQDLARARKEKTLELKKETMTKSGVDIQFFNSAMQLSNKIKTIYERSNGATKKVIKNKLKKTFEFLK